MTDDIEVTGDQLEKLQAGFRAYGQIREDGLSLLTEVAIDLTGFKVIIRPKESQHRGRPHCLIEIDGKSAIFDIITGELLAGDIRPWNRTAEKVIADNSAMLEQTWDRTRPDDQKLS
jgi:hypothetical protein